MLGTRCLLLLPVCIVALAVMMSAGCRQNPYKQGEVIYGYYCENCHMADGSGLAKLIPPLTMTSLKLSNPSALVCLIMDGLPVNPMTGQQMPANLALSDAEMTNLINFLGSKYEANPQTVQIQEVQKWMKDCQTE